MNLPRRFMGPCGGWVVVRDTRPVAYIDRTDPFAGVRMPLSATGCLQEAEQLKPGQTLGEFPRVVPLT